MGVIRVTKCDSCGKTDDGDRDRSFQHWKVGYIVEAPTSLTRYMNPQAKHTAIWCRDCIIKKIGHLPKTAKDPEPPKEQTTTEKLDILIRDIVQEEMEGWDG